MRAFRLCLGLACFLAVVISLQPFREVPRGRAGQQALAGAAMLPAEVVPSGPGQAVYVGGILAAASDVRRERPVRSSRASARVRAAPSTWSRLVPG